MSNNKPPQKPSNNPNSTPNKKENPKPNPNTIQLQCEMKNAPARTGSNSQGFITKTQVDIVTNELSPKKP